MLHFLPEALTACDDNSTIAITCYIEQTLDMVEPSVSAMSAFLPKASLLVGLSFAGFYSQQYLKVLGGNLPVRDQMSFRPEHKEAERRRFLNMEREAAPDDPVIMNPFRHNIPATIRNAGDLPSIGTEEDD